MQWIGIIWKHVVRIYICNSSTIGTISTVFHTLTILPETSHVIVEVTWESRFTINGVIAIIVKNELPHTKTLVVNYTISISDT